MKVVLTVTREYEMDEAHVLAQPDFDPPGDYADTAQLRRWLVESFYELCGWERDHDHVDGSYVRLVSEHDETEWEWPRVLRRPESENSQPGSGA